jgi:hypothetical protein
LVLVLDDGDGDGDGDDEVVLRKTGVDRPGSLPKQVLQSLMPGCLGVWESADGTLI